jgi:ribokinase
VAEECAAALATSLIVTLGADGVLVCDHAMSGAAAVPAPQVNAVDTTGAGDAFAYAIALGANPRVAAAFGCDCASVSGEAPGTQTSFPRGDRLDELKQRLRVTEEPVR